MTITLRPFQEKAVSKLRQTFLDLWKQGGRQLPLFLKAPTGSGKTVIVAQLLKDLSGNPQFNADKAYLWFSFSEDSYLQSKEKFLDYYGGSSELNLIDMNDLSQKSLSANDVFFINWQKIKTKTKDGRILREPSEYTHGEFGIFDEFIHNTQKAGREIILMIDEAHRDTDTELAYELLDLVNPRIIIRITATPKSEPSASDVINKRAGWVEILREEVVEAGLIKEKIVTQTKEDLDKLSKSEFDQDNLLLRLAYNKRLELKEYYKKANEKINPLVLIQLPNDERSSKSTSEVSKLDIVKGFLADNGVAEDEIAIWLSEKKENIDSIRHNDSYVSFLIFKQAAATGWDCPRASILVMYREIKSPIFHAQTIGRIIRMPKAKHYEIPELNTGYLYTNYARNQVELPESDKNKYKPYVYESQRKDDVSPIYLQTVLMSRTDYNDLGDSFQNTFFQIADAFFGIQLDDFVEENKKRIISKGLELKSVKIENKLIVDAQIEDYDNFVKELSVKGQDLDEQTSKNDIERMYNLLCFNLISKQEQESRKYAPERSWGKLKTALNVWFGDRIKEKRESYYVIIVKDLLKQDSVLRWLVGEALEAYRSIRRNEVKKKEERAKKVVTLEIPQQTLYFTDDFEEIEGVKKHSMQKYYARKNYTGKVNESEFVEFLESKDVDWWYKNGNSGSEHFSIPFFDPLDEKEHLFYPDWIVKKGEKIIILDTKQGLNSTVGSSDTRLKANALNQWISNQNRKGNKVFFGGIAARVAEVWLLNDQPNYIPNPNYKDWRNLSTLF